MKKFYTLLYSEENCKDCDISEYLSRVNLLTLSTEETKLCDLEINENECWQTLNKMRKTKRLDPIALRLSFMRLSNVNLTGCFCLVLHVRFLLGK